jgi:hypothetical protein
MKIVKEIRNDAVPVQGMVIEVDDSQNDLVWIYRTINGVRVEGGAFSFEDFLKHVDEFYNKFF